MVRKVFQSIKSAMIEADPARVETIMVDTIVLDTIVVDHDADQRVVAAGIIVRNLPIQRKESHVTDAEEAIHMIKNAQLQMPSVTNVQELDILPKYVTPKRGTKLEL